MVQYKITDKFIISGTQIGMILAELGYLDAQLKEMGLLDDDTAFDTTREIIDNILTENKISSNAAGTEVQ